MSIVSRPLRVGVVGAGPWATMVHAPMIAGNPRTRLTGIWARRPDAADALAAVHGAPAFASFTELCDASDALTFAVPPDVQAELGVIGARAGRALLLEKPIALDIDGAERLAEAVATAGVVTQLVLTWRYTELVRTFLGRTAGVDALGGRGAFITGGLLGGMFATPWRLEHGPLLDLGPHVLDLLEATLGPIETIDARGDLHRWIGLLVGHRNGAVSEVSISGYVRGEPGVAGVEVFTPDGALRVDTTAAFDAGTMPRIVNEFVDAVDSGRAHVLDVHHGLHLQRLLAEAVTQLS